MMMRAGVYPNLLALMSMCRVMEVFGSRAIPSGTSTASSRLKNIKIRALFLLILSVDTWRKDEGIYSQNKGDRCTG